MNSRIGIDELSMGEVTSAKALGCAEAAINDNMMHYCAVTLPFIFKLSLRNVR
jgi:hypothetical protein